MDVSKVYNSRALLQSSSRFFNELTEEASTTLAGMQLVPYTDDSLTEETLPQLQPASVYFQLPFVSSQCMSTSNPLPNSKKDPISTLSKPFAIRKT